jgi:hypothetical protein
VGCLAEGSEWYCMPILRMREACFTASGASVGPVTVDVDRGERAGRLFSDARSASIAALMAGGIVKAGRGCVLIGEYDPRVQPAHCKRIVAFVPHAPVAIGESQFEWYVTYRAALWNVDPVRAIAHARIAMERLEGVHEAFAFPLVGALIGNPAILVMDRPQAAYASQILAAIGPRALFSTHVRAADARAFRTPEAVAEALVR